MTVREKTRLEKFRQLLSSHNTDLGAFTRALGTVVLWRLVLRARHGYCLNFFYFYLLLVRCRCSDARYLDRSLFSEIRGQGEPGLQTVGHLFQLCLRCLQEFSQKCTPVRSRFTYWAKVT